jgi:hypothetical protein
MFLVCITTKNILSIKEIGAEVNLHAIEPAILSELQAA